MANEIYHQSNWGSPKKDGWGDSYFNPSATNKLYTRSDNYENSNGTDKALASKPDTQSVLMTPTAYSVGSMNSILPPYEVLPTELVTNGDFSDGLNNWSYQGDSITIVDGAVRLSRVTNITFIRQNILTSNKTYLVEFDVLDKVDNNGTFIVRLGTNNVYDVSSYEGTRFSKYIVSNGIDFRIYSSSNNGVITIDNVSVKEVRNADFTFDRNSTATRVNKEGLIETVAIDTPRLDYPLIDGVVQSEPALLLEPSRTNLVTYSDKLTATGWGPASSGTGIDPTITDDYGISPDGSQNASRVQFDLDGGTSSSDISYIVFYYTATGVATSNSVYMKSLSGTADVRIRCGSTFKEVDVTTEWQRFDLTDGSTSDRIQILLYGHLSSQTADLLVWGVQAEAGSYTTSYIPTSGSSVTRSAETCNSAGTSDDFNDSEGVLFAEISSDNPLNDNRIYLSDGSNNNRIFIILDKSQSSIKGYVRGTAGYALAITSVGYDASLNHKVLIKYKSNDYSFWINGFEVGSETASTILPSGLNQLSFNGTSNYNPFYGKTKEIAYFKTALTDSELEALTSWDSFNDMATGQLYSIK